MAKVKIYTKTGDSGETSLVTGARVKKNHPRLHAYGAIDELNSQIGLAVAHLSTPLNTKQAPSKETDKLTSDLLKIQADLFTSGSQLACDQENFSQKLPQLSEASILFLESSIDEMEQTLEPLKNFILPGGHLASATLQIARTVCRRTERWIITLQEEGHLVPTNIAHFLNRLSDYLFVASRYINHLFCEEEVTWKG